MKLPPNRPACNPWLTDSAYPLIDYGFERADAAGGGRQAAISALRAAHAPRAGSPQVVPLPPLSSRVRARVETPRGPTQPLVERLWRRLEQPGRHRPDWRLVRSGTE